MSDLVRSSDVGGLQPYTPRWRDTAPREDESLDARRLVMVLLKRKWHILLITALVVVPALIATLLTEKLYQSSTLVQVDPEPVQVLPYRDFELSRLTQYDTFMKTQEQVLAGQTLLLRVAERLAQDDDPSAQAEIDHLYAGMHVARVPNTQAFLLTYTASEPEVAAKVANLYADEYIKLQFENRGKTRGQARALLERELRAAEERIQVSEKQLVEYAQAHNIQKALGNTDLAGEKLSTLAGQVTAAEAEVAVAQSKFVTLQAASTDDFPAALVTSVINSRQSTLLDLEHRLTSLRASYGENWPEVIRTRNEIALVREQLDSEKEAALAQARDQAAMDLRAAQRKLSLLGSSKSQQEQVVTELQSASIQYNILAREVETNRKLYEGLLERLGQTSVDPGIALGNITIIEPARPDETVASPKLWWNLFLASVLGLALGISFVLAHDYWRNSLATVEDVEHVTVLPVLAAIPLVRSNGSRGLPSLASVLRLGKRTLEEPSTSLMAAAAASGNGRLDFGKYPESAEAVRTLCASLLLSKSEHPPRVLVVTSTLPGEGKTTLATELGRALAESGARTLLVECDLRRSKFGDTFGVGEEGGLSLFLSGHIARVKIHPTPLDKLFVVAAGPVAPNPVALLNSEKMSTFLRDMASSFHFVIMDTPPVLPMADARMLGAKADGVVLVVRAGRTSRSLLRRVCSVLDVSGANVLGAVLNGVDLQDMDSSYYHYYHQQSTS